MYHAIYLELLWSVFYQMTCSNMTVDIFNIKRAVTDCYRSLAECDSMCAKSFRWEWWHACRTFFQIKFSIIQARSCSHLPIKSAGCLMRKVRRWLVLNHCPMKKLSSYHVSINDRVCQTGDNISPNFLRSAGSGFINGKNSAIFL
jgi:hypothetical protein